MNPKVPIMSRFQLVGVQFKELYVLSKERIEWLAKIGKMPKQALTQSKVQQPKLTIVL
jgi:hypothetical protein